MTALRHPGSPESSAAKDSPATAPLTAIVVGGSLAGLMTALTLSRVGVQVTVLERNGPDRSRGGGLLISDGLVERVTGWGSGSDPRSVPTSLSAGFHSWHAIYTALTAAAELDPAVDIVYSARALGVSQDERAAWVTTADGRVLGADVVIGADGHRSVVRPAVAPDHPDATFAGYTVWLTAIEEQKLPSAIQGHRAFDQYVFLFHEDVVLLAGSFPGDDGSTARGHRRVGWAVYDSTHNDFLRRNGHVRGSLVHHSVTPDEVPDDLPAALSAIADARWPAPWKEVMLASLEAGIVLGTPIAEYVPHTVADGRLAIVGDAAHVATPMTGSGFTEALCDAEAIATAMSTVVSTEPDARSVTAALRRYEQQRLLAAQSTVRSGQDFSRRFRPAA